MWLIPASVLVLLMSSLAFLNAAERLGDRLGLTRFALGAVLVASLTALPETIIALISPFVGSDEAFEIGEGAVIGAPSITILLGVPVIVYLSKGRTLRVQGQALFNYKVFAALFVLVVLLGFAPSPLRLPAGLIIIGVGLYISNLNVRAPGEKFEATEELYLSRLIETETLSLPLQLFAGLTLMVISAEAFINALSALSNPFLNSAVISPFGTCLPEVIAATFLAKKQKGDIGLAVLAGENMLQATIVSGVGMLVTPWSLPFGALVIAAILSVVALSYTLTPKSMKAAGPIGYLAYLAAAAIL